ncbi:unnamed protein product [Acanthosepion pharaonis]|uniref:Uncharacterized protein n=1 Tax=Acanthosepion pharaonis TaxID=158019 RepID=A0A812DD33_ACAPH|nr:unnamed protein product [Sepia pharaonis]
MFSATLSIVLFTPTTTHARTHNRFFQQSIILKFSLLHQKYFSYCRFLSFPDSFTFFSQFLFLIYFLFLVLLFCIFTDRPFYDLHVLYPTVYFPLSFFLSFFLISSDLTFLTHFLSQLITPFSTFSLFVLSFTVISRSPFLHFLLSIFHFFCNVLHIIFCAFSFLLSFVRSFSSFCSYYHLSILNSFSILLCLFFASTLLDIPYLSLLLVQSVFSPFISSFSFIFAFFLCSCS